MNMMNLLLVSLKNTTLKLNVMAIESSSLTVKAASLNSISFV